MTGGSDCKVRIFQEKEENSGEFESVAEMDHDDWVRDVAWCNNIGATYDLIASCDESNKLKIWRKDQDWTMWQEIELQAPVWKCSWSPVGFMLAVSCGDNETKVLKRDRKTERWEIVSEISEDGQLQQ